MNLRIVSPLVATVVAAALSACSDDPGTNPSRLYLSPNFDDLSMDLTEEVPDRY